MRASSLRYGGAVESRRGRPVVAGIDGAAAAFHSQTGAGERTGKRRGEGAMLIDTTTSVAVRVTPTAVRGH